MERISSARQDASSVLDRLGQVLGTQTDGQLAEEIGVPKTTLSSWKRRNSVPYAECVRVAQSRRVSLDWLLLGEPQSSSESSESPQAETAAQEGKTPLETGPEGLSELPVQKIASVPKVGGTFGTDRNNLKRAIETVEEALKATNREMEPEVKADLILALVDFYQSTPDADQGVVLRLIQSASSR